MNSPQNNKTPKIPEWDAVEDILVSEVNQFGLEVLPYFFDAETAKQLHMEYIYLGIRPSKKRDRKAGEIK